MMHVHILDVSRHHHLSKNIIRFWSARGYPGISDKRNTSMNSERLFKGLVCTLLQDKSFAVSHSQDISWYFCFLVSLWLDWLGILNRRWCIISKSWLFQPGGNNRRWQVGKQRWKWGSFLTFEDGNWKRQKFLVDSLSYRIADSKNSSKKTIMVMVWFATALTYCKLTDRKERYLHISIAQRHLFPRASFHCHLCPPPEGIRVPEMFDQRMMSTTISTCSLISEAMRIDESLRIGRKRHLLYAIVLAERKQEWYPKTNLHCMRL